MFVTSWKWVDLKYSRIRKSQLEIGLSEMSDVILFLLKKKFQKSFDVKHLFNFFFLLLIVGNLVNKWENYQPKKSKNTIHVFKLAGYYLLMNVFIQACQSRLRNSANVSSRLSVAKKLWTKLALYVLQFLCDTLWFYYGPRNLETFPKFTSFNLHELESHFLQSFKCYQHNKSTDKDQHNNSQKHSASSFISAFCLSLYSIHQLYLIS